MIFHRWVLFAFAPAIVLGAAFVARSRVRTKDNHDLIAFGLALVSVSLGGVAALVLKVLGMAYAVKRYGQGRDLGWMTTIVGGWALDFNVFTWQHGARLLLALGAVGLGILSLRYRPRWPGILACLWALGALLETRASV